VENKAERHEFKWFGHNRTLCDVLEDMRSCSKSQNYGPLPSLIEECQVMGNQMEAGLRNQKDLNSLQLEFAKARKAYKELKKEYKELAKKVDDLKPEDLEK